MKKYRIYKILFFFSIILCCHVLVGGGSLVYAKTASIETTLIDGSVQKGSYKTFDVWALDGSGNKVASNVTLNGTAVASTWDDTDKTSYTLHFTTAGENTIVITSSVDGNTKTYHVNYQPALDGEVIGRAVWSVELSTIGCNYLVEPTFMDIKEGETAADALIRLLKEHGFCVYYGGSTKKGFYLAYIADGDKAGKNYNSYSGSGKAQNPHNLNLSPAIPEVLRPHLEKNMTFFDPDDYEKNWNGYIGEFVFTNGSGWMYSVNNVFPNVGFSDFYLSDADVVRVQFTLSYGADIGGTSSLGAGSTKDDIALPNSSYYSIADKDDLTSVLAAVNESGMNRQGALIQAYQKAIQIACTLDAPQNQVDFTCTDLKSLYEKLSGKKVTEPTKATTTHSASDSKVNSTDPTNQVSMQGAVDGNQSVETAEENVTGEDKTLKQVRGSSNSSLKDNDTQIEMQKDAVSGEALTSEAISGMSATPQALIRRTIGNADILHKIEKKDTTHTTPAKKIKSKQTSYFWIVIFVVSCSLIMIAVIAFIIDKKYGVIQNMNHYVKKLRRKEDEK